MPKYPYKQVGTSFDRNYRNDENQFKKDVETDIKEQKDRVDNIIVNNPQPSEVVDARGGFPVLRDKLQDVDAQLAEKDNLTNNINSLKLTAGRG